MIRRSPSYRFSFTFARVMTTAIDLPSGEICGSFRLAIRSRSDGCQRCACAAAAMNNNAKKIRFIGLVYCAGARWLRLRRAWAVAERRSDSPVRQADQGLSDEGYSTEVGLESPTYVCSAYVCPTYVSTRVAQR